MNKNTKLLSPPDVRTAAELLRGGALVALPTETVYGLAADALNPDAVAAIFTAKGRPQDNPLIVHIARPEQADALARDIPEKARALMDAFWPGPLTLVLHASEAVPKIVTAGLPTVAVRCPDHPVIRAVLEECGLPLAAPSANLSGRPSPTRAEHVLADLGGRVDAVVDGGDCAVGLESTVLDMTADPPCLLRSGAVTPDMLREVLGIDVEVSAGHADAPRSPGMKYRHYAPNTSMCVLTGSRDGMRSWASGRTNAAVLCCDEERSLFPGLTVYSYGPSGDTDCMARRLYALLRDADKGGHELIAATCPAGPGAFRDRLLRAAGYNEIRIN